MSTFKEDIAAIDAVINAEGTVESVRAALQQAKTARVKSEIIATQELLKTLKALLPTKPLSPKQQALKEKRDAAKAAKEAAKKAAEDAAKKNEKK